MAEPINLRWLNDEQKGVLVEAIPLLTKKTDGYYWDNPDFKNAYKKWLETTKSEYVDGGFEQFRLAIHQMRKTIPLTYKNKKVITDAD